MLYDERVFTYYFICLEVARRDMEDVKRATKDTREDTKKIKGLIESLMKNISNTDNAQIFTQIKELFTQLAKGNFAELIYFLFIHCLYVRYLQFTNKPLKKN